MRFLTGGNILKQIQELVRQNGDISVAVAYWGDGAVEQTGIAHREKDRTRILCDLLSGACNPDEIAALLELGATVRTRRGMHAKVWANGDHVIVGSANASMNGLGFEADSSSVPNVEAAVQLHDHTIAGEIRDWFDRNWGLATPVNDEMLAHSRDLWRRRQTAPRLSPAIMGHRILAYCEDIHSPQALDHWHANWNPSPAPDEPEEGYPLYEMGPDWAHIAEQGTVLLDFSSPAQHEKFAFGGSWRVEHDPARLDNRNILVFVARVQNSRMPIRDLAVSREELSRCDISQMVTCWVAGNEWQTRPAFGDIYLDMNFADFFFGKKGDCLARGNAGQCDACPFRGAPRRNGQQLR